MNIEKSFNVALAYKSMTKADLAEALNCTGVYITRISKGGSMSVSKLQEVCDVLGYKVWEFIRLGDE